MTALKSSVVQLKLDPSKTLARAVEDLSMTTSLEEITQTVAKAARELTGADGTSFVLRDGDKCYYVDENAIGPLWKGLRFQASSCISGFSMNHRQPVLIEDVFADPRVPHDAYRVTFVKSLCMVPIREESPIGAIGAYWAKEHLASAEDVKALQVLANSCAVALENFELREAMRKRAEEKTGLVNRQKELETAMHSLAHDLRSPLTTVAGLAELLKMRTERVFADPESIDEASGQRMHEYIDSILRTCGNMADQISRMLMLYQVTNQNLSKEHTDITAISNELAQGLKIQHPERMIEFKIDHNLEANADPKLIRLALENLLSNAVKYSSRKPHSLIQVGLDQGKPGKRSFYVKDNGEGFDAADAHKLFRPLVRLHKNEDFHGTGLGLVSVARIVELHGGSIHAEGTRSKGATFYFTLPD